MGAPPRARGEGGAGGGGGAAGVGARAEDDSVLEELRQLRERVRELEDWKRAREQESSGVEVSAIQSAVDAWFAAHPESALASGAVRAPKSLGIDFGGQIRVRPEWQHGTYSPADVDGRDTNQFTYGRVRLAAKARIVEHLSALVEIQDARVWGSEPGTISNTGNVDLSQGWFEIGNLFCWEKTRLRVGRQAMPLGDERFVGATEWSNFARRFDGITFLHEDGNLQFTAWAHRVAEGFIDPVQGGDADTDFAGFWATMSNVVPRSKTEVFGLFVRSGLSVAGEPDSGATVSTNTGNTEHATLGFRVFGSDESGIDWDAQAAAQRGDIAGDPLRAYAARAGLGYTFDSDWKPRVGLEYDYATGEERPDDGDRDQFQVLFPTNHAYYGIHDYVAWSNVRAWGLHFSVEPTTDVKVETSFWDFRLDETAGGWVLDSGVRLRPGMPGLERALGREFDLVVTWKVNPAMTLQLGWAHFFAGRFVEETQGDGDALDTDFAYVQALVTF